MQQMCTKYTIMFTVANILDFSNNLSPGTRQEKQEHFKEIKNKRV